MAQKQFMRTIKKVLAGEGMSKKVRRMPGSGGTKKAVPAVPRTGLPARQKGRSTSTPTFTREVRRARRRRRHG